MSFSNVKLDHRNKKRNEYKTAQFWYDFIRLHLQVNKPWRVHERQNFSKFKTIAVVVTHNLIHIHRWCWRRITFISGKTFDFSWIAFCVRQMCFPCVRVCHRGKHAPINSFCAVSYACVPENEVQRTKQRTQFLSRLIYVLCHRPFFALNLNKFMIHLPMQNIEKWVAWVEWHEPTSHQRVSERQRQRQRSWAHVSSVQRNIEAPNGYKFYCDEIGVSV